MFGPNLAHQAHWLAHSGAQVRAARSNAQAGLRGLAGPDLGEGLHWGNDDAERDFTQGVPADRMNEPLPGSGQNRAIEASGTLNARFNRAYGAAVTSANQPGGTRSRAAVDAAKAEVSGLIQKVEERQRFDNVAGGSANIATFGLAMQKGRTREQDSAYREAVWYLRDAMYRHAGMLEAAVAADAPVIAAKLSAKVAEQNQPGTPALPAFDPNAGRRVQSASNIPFILPKVVGGLALLGIGFLIVRKLKNKA